MLYYNVEFDDAVRLTIKADGIRAEDDEQAIQKLKAAIEAALDTLDVRIGPEENGYITAFELPQGVYARGFSATETDEAIEREGGDRAYHFWQG